MDAKEEIRSRLNIVDVIGEYVQLKRAGRSYKGLSPFTQEKSPSFFVSPEKQIWHCFSTNKGGDVFSFIMEVEGLDFKAVLELLARKAGVELTQLQRGDGTLNKKRERLQEATALAERYFQQAMVQSKTAQEYIFKKRGMNKTVVQAFGIGYAPESHEVLTNLLLKRGFSERELIDAGLSSRRRSGLGDIFRGRVMIPLRDPQGRPLGFTGRLIANVENAPKYLNTPQTMLYDKSRHVYGLDLAKEAIRTNDYVVLVEGNLDVVSSHQAGVKQVVATAGTAVTEYHLRTLMRFTPNIRLCFDADKAGVAATERSIPIAQAVGVSLSIITLPGDAKDPDELIQKDTSAWQKALEAPRDVVEWVIDQYAARLDVMTAEGKAKVSSKALELVRLVTDPVQAEHYIAYLSKIIGTSAPALHSKLAQVPASAAKASLKPVHTLPSGPDPYAYQDTYLGLCAAYPEVRDSMRRISAECMEGEVRQRMFTVLQALGSTRLEAGSLPDPLQKDDTYGKIILFKAEQRYGGSGWTSTGLYHEAVQLANRANDDTKKRKRKEIGQAMQAAHERGDAAALDDLTKQYQMLMKKES